MKDNILLNLVKNTFVDLYLRWFHGPFQTAVRSERICMVAYSSQGYQLLVNVAFR